MSLINLDYLKDLADGDQEFISEILTIFKTHTPTDLIKLDQAGTRGDHAVIHSVSHKLKSSAANLGMSLTQEKFIRIEQLAKSGGNMDEIRPLITSAIGECRSAIVEINQLLETRAF